MHYDHEVDATGLKCPLPILRCKKGLNEIQSDQILKIISTDPGSKKDFDAFLSSDRPRAFISSSMTMASLPSLSKNVI